MKNIFYFQNLEKTSFEILRNTKIADSQENELIQELIYELIFAFEKLIEIQNSNKKLHSNLIKMDLRLKIIGNLNLKDKLF